MNESEILLSIVNSTLKELHKIGEQHSCIRASLILNDSLRLSGFESAFLLSVQVKVLNSYAASYIKNRHLTSSITKESMPTNCRIVEIGGKETPKNEWPGHLVVILPNFSLEKTLICDLALPRASKPDWGINLEPLVRLIPNTFPKEEDLQVNINNCVVIYRGLIEDTSYKETPLWKKRSNNKVIVDSILKAS